MIQVYQIVPTAKPRMTQRDKWNKRPATDKYWCFKDEVRLKKVNCPNGSKITFIVPMPKSWSKKKKAELIGKGHKQKPDIDNYLKALLDAIYDDDSHIWDIHAVKRWGESGQIIIETY